MGLFSHLRPGRAEPDSSPEPAEGDHARDAGSVPDAEREPQPPREPLGPEEVAELLEHLRERAVVEVLTATQPFEEFRDELVHDVVAEGVPRAEAEAVVLEEWERRVALATAHRAHDMSAALRQAFAALEVASVATAETLGHDRDEGHDLATEAARDTLHGGYVFFHLQDTARLVQGPADLYLRFGAVSGEPEHDVAVGSRVAAALRAAGLPVLWDETPDAAIVIPEMAWYAVPGPAAPVAPVAPAAPAAPDGPAD